MGKKGLGHVEVILAFVIFVSALIFVLYLFNPGERKNLDAALLNEIYAQIENNASVELAEYGVKINNSAQATDIIGVNLSFEIGTELNAKVTDMSGNKLNTSEIMKNNETFCIRKNSLANWPVFAYIYLSTDLNGRIDGASSCYANESYYQISGSYSRKVFSEKKLLILNDSYNIRYGELKVEFGLPVNKDFDFKIGFDNGRMINAQREVPENIEVLAINKRIELLNVNGDIEFASVMIRIW